MKQKLLILALLFAGVLNAKNYDIWFDYDQFTDENLSFASGIIVYNPAENVLTINNANASANYLSIGQSVTLKFVGNSFLMGIYEDTNLKDVYTLTITTQGKAKLTVPFESAFYVNDMIVAFDKCDFTLDNSFGYDITQATLFAGEIDLGECVISDPVGGKISKIDASDIYTITDGNDNFVRSFTVSAMTATAIENVELSSIYAKNGRIFGAENARIFTVSGQDVTAQNGQLKGIYIVKSANQTAKVVVK